MNTSLIKKETADRNMEPSVKISRRMNGSAAIRKNDLVTLLREENDALYDEYAKVIKRNAELRAIVEKQQKIINAIYNAELNILLPPAEKEVAGMEQVVPEVQNQPSVFEHPAVENPVPGIPPVEIPVEAAVAEMPVEDAVAEMPPVEIPAPEVKPPQPLPVNDLAKRIRMLQRKKWQNQPPLIEKAKFLLAIYNAPGGIRNNVLFADCGISRVTGLRYVRFFRKFSLVSSGGTYCITDPGKKFVEGEPNPEWDKYRFKNWRTIQ